MNVWVVYGVFAVFFAAFFGLGSLQHQVNVLKEEIQRLKSKP
jgi:hypothetical protein